MIVLFVFILGLIFGSFINALLYRLHVGESLVHGRSKCPDCGHTLSAKDLVPLISWAILKARCRYCRKPISWQYPVIELAMALAFVICYLVSGIADLQSAMFDLRLASWLLFSVFLMIVFVYDARHYLILDSVIIPASISALVLNLILGYSWQNLLLGVVIASGFFALQFFVSRGKWIGFGDVKLGVFLGLMLGWPNILAGLFLAYILGSIVGIGLILSKKKEWGGQVPFGTFLALASFIAMLYGQQLIDWYLRLLYV